MPVSSGFSEQTSTRTGPHRQDKPAGPIYRLSATALHCPFTQPRTASRPRRRPRSRPRRRRAGRPRLYRRRGSVPQGTVWPHVVILLPPPLGQDSCLQYRIEDLAVQELVPQLPVEALDIAVFPRTDRLDVPRSNIQPAQPLPHHRRGELATDLTIARIRLRDLHSLRRENFGANHADRPDHRQDPVPDRPRQHVPCLVATGASTNTENPRPQGRRPSPRL